MGLVSESSCQFTQTSIFNTYGNSYEDNRLRSFINGISDGRIVVAAISYDGVNRLDSYAKTALESIGSAYM